MTERQYQTEEEQYIIRTYYSESKKIERKGRAKKILLLSLPIILFAYVICPPIIMIDSPKSMVYMTNSIPLSYRRVLPQPLNIYDLSYVVDDQSEKPLSNKNLTLSYGNHTLRVYASIDLFGRRRLMVAEVKFTVSKVFHSLSELILFLKRDDLNYREWTPDYTCHNFAEDFIKRARRKGYYCFVYLALYDEELASFVKAIESIEVNGWYYDTSAFYTTIVRDPFTGRIIDGIIDASTGHAVVKTTVNGVDVIIDPQTDIILSYPDFTVLYEGEITQEG